MMNNKGCIGIIHDEKHEFLDIIANGLTKTGHKVQWYQVDEYQWLMGDEDNIFTCLKSNDVLLMDRVHEDKRFLQEIHFLIDQDSTFPRIINSSDSYQRARNKTVFYSWCHSNNIPIPKTYIIQSINELEKMRKYPYRWVVKPSLGHSGLGIFEFKFDYKDHIDRVKVLIDEEGFAIIQQVILNQHKRDIRVHIVHGEITDTWFRYSTNTDDTQLPLCNIAQGSRPDFSPIPAYACELALKVVSLLKLDYAGVDLIEDENNDICIIEVNPEPNNVPFDWNLPEVLVKYIDGIVRRKKV